jgi:hypothetical protein
VASIIVRYGRHVVTEKCIVLALTPTAMHTQTIVIMVYQKWLMNFSLSPIGQQQPCRSKAQHTPGHGYHRYARPHGQTIAWSECTCHFDICQQSTIFKRFLLTPLGTKKPWPPQVSGRFRYRLNGEARTENVNGVTGANATLTLRTRATWPRYNRTLQFCVTMATKRGYAYNARLNKATCVAVPYNAVWTSTYYIPG